MARGLGKGLLAVLLLLLQWCVVAEIYTWRDEHGVPSFGGQPSGPGATKVEPGEIPTYRSPGVLRRQQQERVTSVLEHERRHREQTAAERRQRREQRLAECRRARKRLTLYLRAGYLYEEDAEGDHRVLSREERGRATDEAQADVARLCE